MNDAVDSQDGVNNSPEKFTKIKPIKALPTDRLQYDTQLSIIRAYGAASGPDKQPTSNAEVAKVADISASSISITNPFLIDTGLLVREGMKQRPSQAIFDYCSAWEWNQETAGHKLAPALSNTWFAKALLPRLNFRSLSVDEAVGVLADEAKAPKDYKDQLSLLLNYLATAGVIQLDGNVVTKGNVKRDSEPTPNNQVKKYEQDEKEDQNVERFEIPLPNKAPAVIIVPKDLDADDWEMLTQMMAIYVKRWKSNVIKTPAKQDQNAEDKA